MKQVSYICDVCGRVKQESNHWFTVAMGEPCFHVSRWEPTDDAIDICGQECLHRKLNEFLANPATKEST